MPTAIVMGAELHGVAEEGLRLADRHVTIPMMGMVHSLNVSVATSLLLFEAMRQRQHGAVSGWGLPDSGAGGGGGAA